MINLRLLTPLVLVTALGPVPLLAQPEAAGTDAKPVQQPQQPATAPAQPATTQPANKHPAPETRKDSPFDYRSSEEISEDVPVSFPVDI